MIAPILASTIKRHEQAYGNRHQPRLLDQTIEECAELIAAIQQFKRGDSIDKVREELADASICIEALSQCIGEEGIAEWKTRKEQRLNSRLDMVISGEFAGTREP